MGGLNYRAIAGTSPSTSTVWPAANRAVYIPFSLAYSYTVRRVFWSNGAVVSGNVDAGVYSRTGTRLASCGSTAQAGTTDIQYSASLASPLTLAAGDYFFGLAYSSATATCLSSTQVTAANGRGMGLYQQAAAFALPATATFAAWASTVYPMCGITRSSSGF